MVDLSTEAKGYLTKQYEATTTKGLLTKVQQFNCTMLVAASAFKFWIFLKTDSRQQQENLML